MDAIKRMKAHGMTVKINTIIIPGVNDGHIPEVAKAIAGLGVDIMNCMALVPVKGAAFEDLPAPDGLMTSRTRLLAGQHVPQMTHCARCRADAVGLINEPMTTQQMDDLNHYANTAPSESAPRPCVAVATLEGALVNQHLGEAARFVIYEESSETASGYKFKEVRRAPEQGGGAGRWQDLANTLRDCRAVLVTTAGPSPTAVLNKNGLRVVEMEGLIEEGLRAIYTNQPVPRALQRRFTGCSSGAGCKGTGTGCG